LKRTEMTFFILFLTGETPLSCKKAHRRAYKSILFFSIT
jgi:hypothetical protein